MDIKTRILHINSYNIITNNIRKKFKLNDNTICFFNGKNWNAILLDTMLAYPILYFNFWSSKENKTYINTLLVCPITMRSIIYKGQITIIDIIDDKLFLLNNDTNDKFFMDAPYTGTYDETGKEKRIKSHIKRYDVKIMSIRDVLMFITDAQYVVIKKKYIDSLIFNKSYYTNTLTYDNTQITNYKYHPKTIVYMIQYYSHNAKKYKYILIHGKDINKNNISGYNYKLSDIFSYLSIHINTLITKKAYIYPILYYYVDKLYKNYMSVYL
jgi:hypothetical protein